jgi:uncharacterized protein (DUF362 family)
MTKPEIDPSLNRRDFLRLAASLGGAAALTAFLEACSKAGIDPATVLAPTEPPVLPTRTQGITSTSTPSPTQPAPTESQTQPSATPTETAADGKARIAFVQTTDRAGGVRKAIDLLGINLVAGKRLFLKPNFNSADPAPGSTHPDVLFALVMALKGMGAAQITVGDRSGMGDTRQVMEKLGVFSLADQLGFDTVVLDELSSEDWAMIQPAAGHWAGGFPFARPCLEAEALVQTCNLKTHRYGGHFTLSLKNSVGMVAHRHGGHNFMTELHNSAHQRRMIAEINLAYTPALIVMDGIQAFISGGPDTGERASPNVILAGVDRIAMDAVGVALLRYHGCRTEAAQGAIFELEQIARAVELGLGVDRPEKIELVTADADSQAYSAKVNAILLA